MPINERSNKHEPWKDTLNPLDDVVANLARMGDAEGLGDFSIKEFFADIFKPHNVEEIEQSLIVGTAITTPSIKKLKISYPKPWLFFRLLTSSSFCYSYNSRKNHYYYS